MSGLSARREAINQEFQAELGRIIESDAALSAMFTSRSPRYAFWARGQRLFCYNTEPQPRAPRWLSWVYEPVGPGMRTGKATQWVMQRSRRHATRAKAKARALKLWEAAK